MKKYIEYNKLFLDLFEHIENKNFKGIDPSTIKFDPKIIRITNGINKVNIKILKKLLLYIFAQMQIFFNPIIQKRLMLPKIYFTKSLALVASSLAIYDYNLFNNKISDIVNIILSLKLGDDFIWAHNIDYYFNDKTKITTKTPNLITSYFVANSFFEIYMNSYELKYLDLFNKTINSMLKIFTYDEFSNDSICFMYTPNSNYHVHNANILFAEILVKYIFLNNYPENSNEILSLVRKALNYSLNDFSKTNCIPYAGPPTINLSMDNYHTGYILRGLKNIIKYSNGYFDKLELHKYIVKGLNLYFNFFIGKYVYKFKKNAFYSTIESHSLAESYLIYSEFQDYLDKDSKKTMVKAMENSFIRLWDKNEKYFYNNIKVLLMLKVYDKTDMIRWSNSWMLYAISKFIKFKKGKNPEF